MFARLNLLIFLILLGLTACSKTKPTSSSKKDFGDFNAMNFNAGGRGKDSCEPVDGGYGEWDNACENNEFALKECRYCTNPAPSCGGKMCDPDPECRPCKCEMKETHADKTETGAGVDFKFKIDVGPITGGVDVSGSTSYSKEISYTADGMMKATCCQGGSGSLPGGFSAKLVVTCEAKAEWKVFEGVKFKAGAPLLAEVEVSVNGFVKGSTTSKNTVNSEERKSNIACTLGEARGLAEAFFDQAAAADLILDCVNGAQQQLKEKIIGSVEPAPPGEQKCVWWWPFPWDC